MSGRNEPGLREAPPSVGEPERRNGGPQTFHSVLFQGRVGGAAAAKEGPSFFGDLNLDQVLESLTTGREEYDLAGFFYEPLHAVPAVYYRQEVMLDLEQESVRKPIVVFASQMKRIREQLTLVAKLRDRHQRERWFLSATRVYCDAVRSFADQLSSVPLTSRGLHGLRQYLNRYVGSRPFLELVDEASELANALDRVRYAVHLRGLRVSVRPYEDEPDLTARVEETFAKFRQGDVKDYTVAFPAFLETNPVESRILALVAQLHPQLFARLADYVERRGDSYLDATIARFDREVQFYLAYLDCVEPLRSAGLAFCYPTVSERSKQIRVGQAFDLALAQKLVPSGATVVCNDIDLHGDERIIVVTGPNQGGKTTFARMVGQLHHLAALGLPVPGTEAELFLPDRLFTHFEREEDLTTLRGKFEDELVRLHEILETATSEAS